MTEADLILQGAALVGAAAAMFLVAFSVHVVAWRLSRTTPSGSFLIVILVLSVAFQCLLVAAGAAFGTPEVNAPQLALTGLLALQFCACYAISYPAMQANSPSLEMARQLSRAGAAGLSRTELYSRLSEASLVRERIDDLVSDGLAACSGERISCTGKGVILARLFALWKAFLKEPKGG